MNGERDLFDLSILYDTARGFIGLRAPDKVLRHALLSLMGSCGASFALFLRRQPDGSLALDASRGFSGEAPARIRLTRATERALGGAPGPYAEEGIHSLGAEVRRLEERLGVCLLVGLSQDERLVGILALGPKLLGEPYTAREISLVREIAALTSLALTPETARPATGARSRRASGRSIEALREQHPALRPIKGDGPSTLALFEELLALAEFDLPVLIVGETGTGKELVAQALHGLSPRADQPFEAINCAAIPPELIASALFGHERGAFTGAISTVRGVFERAEAGTVFLDEIGDMPPEAQASLLRVLQERRFRRVGGERVLDARARVISATNRDLVQAVEAGRFRADLFYRVRMYSVRVPPLRERREEIPALVAHILEQHASPRGWTPVPTREFMQELSRRELPGNVRELESLVLGALVRARGEGTLVADHLPAKEGDLGVASRPRLTRGVVGCRVAARVPGGPGGQAHAEGSRDEVPSYDEMERQYIQSVLRLTDGNRKQAAALMRIPRTTLNARIKKLGLSSRA